LRNRDGGIFAGAMKSSCYPALPKKRAGSMQLADANNGFLVNLRRKLSLSWRQFLRFLPVKSSLQSFLSGAASYNSQDF
jgi:hypothetical protein